MNTKIRFRKAKPKDIPALLAIYNYEVTHGVATFDTDEKTLPEWEQWFQAHNTGNHPLLIAELDGNVAGYASLSSYRDKDAYRGTVELSIYIDANYRKQGIGTQLMEHILAEGRKDSSIHTIISVITAGNAASQKLHEEFGFTFCGIQKEVGMKFGAYQDTITYQLLL